VGSFISHLVRCPFKYGDSEQDKADQDTSLEKYPEDGPYMGWYRGKHNPELRGIRVIDFPEVFVIRNVPDTVKDALEPDR